MVSHTGRSFLSYRGRFQLLQTGLAGEIGRTALTFEVFLLFALPFLFTLAALVAELTDRSHQFARLRIALRLYSQRLVNGAENHTFCRFFEAGLQDRLSPLFFDLIDCLPHGAVSAFPSLQ